MTTGPKDMLKYYYYGGQIYTHCHPQKGQDSLDGRCYNPIISQYINQQRRPV